MKTPAGVFIQPVLDASTAGLPHWARIAHALRHAAASGAVARGARLPSARQLAQDWGVSRGAVDDAFAQLQLEGLIERRVGDGSYLSAAAAMQLAPLRDAAPQAQRVLRHSLLQGCPVARLESARRPLHVPPMHPRSGDLEAFPLDLWRRLLLQAHAEPQRALLDGVPVGGLPSLRAAIARHLAVHRGLACTPQQVIVTHGPGEGVQWVCRLLLEAGDTVWLEHPGHASLPLLMQSMGMKVQGLPLDAAGLDVAAGLRLAPQARLCYLHPLTQYPLGVRTSRQRGDELLDWARRSGGWIVEGQMNDELVAPALQPAPLMARDANARTIMLGTFEGVAFPSLRVGYLVLPQALARDFIGAIQACGEHAAATVQWALAEFIDRGHMTAHLAKLRERRVQRCEQVRRSLLATLPAGLRAGPMDSGLHLSLHLPPEMADTAVAARLRAQRIFVEPLSVLAWQAGLAHRLNGIVLGYGGLDAPALEHGLRTISQALTEMQGACYPPAGQNT